LGQLPWLRNGLAQLKIRCSAPMFVWDGHAGGRETAKMLFYVNCVMAGLIPAIHASHCG
jgi:hypothetical protein